MDAVTVILLLLAGLVGCWRWTLPHIREHRREQAERRTRCGASGHPRRRRIFAMGDWRFPVEHCPDCGYQRPIPRGESRRSQRPDST
jgi:hypothetical protein